MAHCPTSQEQGKPKDVMLFESPAKGLVGVRVEIGPQSVGVPGIEPHSDREGEWPKETEKAGKGLHVKSISGV